MSELHIRDLSLHRNYRLLAIVWLLDATVCSSNSSYAYTSTHMFLTPQKPAGTVARSTLESEERLELIQLRVSEVAAAFKQAANTKELSDGRNNGDSELYSASLADSDERFQLWAGSLGASHPPSDPRSLQYRLRSAPQIAGRIYELLGSLIESLRYGMLYCPNEDLIVVFEKLTDELCIDSLERRPGMAV